MHKLAYFNILIYELTKIVGHQKRR